MFVLIVTSHGHHHHAAAALAASGDDTEGPFGNGDGALGAGVGGTYLISTEPFKPLAVVVLGVDRVEDGAADDCRED